MQPDTTNDEKDDFKLSFKPKMSSGNNNGSTNPHWMSSTAQFMEQTHNSPSSILLSGFNDNSSLLQSHNAHANPNLNGSALSMSMNIPMSAAVHNGNGNGNASASAMNMNMGGGMNG